MKIKWLTNSCFEIMQDNLLITMDPCIRYTKWPLPSEEYRKPDFIILSHLHFDHISELKYLYEMYKPKIITGDLGKYALCEAMDPFSSDVIPIPVNMTLDYNAFKITRIFSVHKRMNAPYSEQVRHCVVNKCCEDEPWIAELQGWGSVEMCNFLIEFPNGESLLTVGGMVDDAILNIIKNIKPTVALIQKSDEETMLKAVEAVKPECFIVYHQDYSATKEKWLPMLQNLKKNSRIPMLLLDNCEEVEIKSQKVR